MFREERTMVFLQFLAGRNKAGVVLVQKGTVLPIMNKAEKKRATLLATLGDLNRPLRVRPVSVMGQDWWAVDAEDTWPGMVMDLRRLGFESMAWGEEVLVREGPPDYESQMSGPAELGGLRPFPLVHPTIKIRPESYSTGTPELSYLDEYDDETDFEEDDFEPEDFQHYV